MTHRSNGSSATPDVAAARPGVRGRETPAKTVGGPPLDYARRRLLLGITAVGTMVLLAAALLASGLPGRLLPSPEAGFGPQLGSLSAFLGMYALLHAPFDVLGGYVLPRSCGRSHKPWPAFVAGLIRGVLGHTGLLFLIGAAMLAAGQILGPVGLPLAGIAASLVVLHSRFGLARLLAPIRDVAREAGRRDGLDTEVVATDDEGFTGGITGVVRPRVSVIPQRWQDALGPIGEGLARRRRDLAVSTGQWARGRVVALSFTWIGLGVATLAVDRSEAGSAVGVVDFASAFTLWSFLGLLTLPTLSRQGARRVDAALLDDAPESAATPQEVQRLIGRLDELQDDEPSRRPIVEAIFHPIPSVENRGDPGAGRRTPAAWDAARTNIVLGLSGMGLLSRAVHCNCGRPELWIFLPTD